MITYRQFQIGEENDVCGLISEIFDEFVAPDYSEEGVQEFYRYANAEALVARRGDEVFCLVAESSGRLVGMIEMLACAHISLLFVRERGKGIAKELFNRALARCKKERPGISELTVNSSRYAVSIYERLGFRTIDKEQEKNGIIFIPMRYAVCQDPS